MKRKKKKKKPILTVTISDKQCTINNTKYIKIPLSSTQTYHNIIPHIIIIL